MSSFALETAEDRADFIYQFAIPAKIPAYIVEKDFWVCWLLGRIFATPGLGPGLCVQGAALRLSKVFGAISRFSEDIDLGLSPASLGWSEAELDDAPSTSQRRKRMEKISVDCAAMVEGKFRPELEQVVCDVLGARPSSGAAGFAGRVRLHKSRYFGSSWANYATATPGTLRILPPESRMPEVRRDYAAMERNVSFAAAARFAKCSPFCRKPSRL